MHLQEFELGVRVALVAAGVHGGRNLGENHGGHRPPYPFLQSPLISRKAGFLVPEQPAGTPTATGAENGLGLRRIEASQLDFCDLSRLLGKYHGGHRPPYPSLSLRLSGRPESLPYIKVLAGRGAGNPAFFKKRVLPHPLFRKAGARSSLPFRCLAKQSLR
jgi:hypothetical protein